MTILSAACKLMYVFFCEWETKANTTHCFCPYLDTHSLILPATCCLALLYEQVVDLTIDRSNQHWQTV